MIGRRINYTTTRKSGEWGSGGVGSGGVGEWGSGELGIPYWGRTTCYR
ncbi:MAG: hypothetical protein DSM106950_41980 [Stigonema ocellatum SAG 48.90 = DSM 106950]|nr:hypothetical protein [Stigonema ocellatum SAG 48.90 = DSM 106950]